jgi:hypothetical protein
MRRAVKSAARDRSVEAGQTSSAAKEDPTSKAASAMETSPHRLDDRRCSDRGPRLTQVYRLYSSAR